MDVDIAELVAVDGIHVNTGLSGRIRVTGLAVVSTVVAGAVVVGTVGAGAAVVVVVWFGTDVSICDVCDGSLFDAGGPSSSR